MRFVSVKKNDIKGRKNDLKSVVNAFKKVVFSNPTKEFAEYFKKENEKSREHKKSLCSVTCSYRRCKSFLSLMAIDLVQCLQITPADMDIL